MGGSVLCQCYHSEMVSLVPGKMSSLGILLISLLPLTPYAGGQQPASTGQAVLSQGDFLTAVGATLGPGDILDITILGIPELSQRVRVDNKGLVSLPLVGEVKVEGLTQHELELSLAERLVSMELLVNPQVSVFVQQSIGSRVKVLGEVNTQGVYQLIGRQTLLDAIAAAGGVNQRGSHKATVLHADGSHEQINMNEALANTERLVNGDTVTVERAPIIYVIGEVQRPGGFILPDERQRSSVLEALALSGGPTRLAKLSDTVVYERTPEGLIRRRTTIQNLVNGKPGDYPVADGEIVYVPLSHVRETAQRAIEAAFSVGAGIAIYR
jgi:polysaccharide export outer membrane protein